MYKVRKKKALVKKVRNRTNPSKENYYCHKCGEWLASRYFAKAEEIPVKKKVKKKRKKR